MADLPQDPRQLARDILSGKIKLEDLQREQARRQAAAQRQPAEDRPVPLPNFNRPAERPAPQARPEAARIPLPTHRPRPQAQRPQQPKAVRKVRREAPPVRPIPPASEPEPVHTQLAPMPEAPPQPVSSADKTAQVIRAAMRQKQSLRHAVLLSEILQPPVSLRE